MSCDSAYFNTGKLIRTVSRPHSAAAGWPAAAGQSPASRLLTGVTNVMASFI
jgi:hypothetical protein